jgi:transposase
MKLSNCYYKFNTESSARKYLLGFCFDNYQRFCPRCRYRKFYRMSDGRRRCRRCRYTFHDFSQRWINDGNIPFLTWLRIIEFFELELSIREMSSRLGLSYGTVYKAVTTIRLTITAHAEEDTIAIDGAHGPRLYNEWRRYEGERRARAPGPPPVFGFREHNGRVSLCAVPAIGAEMVLNLAVGKTRWGNIVYTDRYEGFDALMFCHDSRMRIGQTAVFSEDPVFIDRHEGFWSYAKERIAKYYGITSRRFPLYLKELEFRYNHREEGIFPIIAGFLCDLKP